MIQIAFPPFLSLSLIGIGTGIALAIAFAIGIAMEISILVLAGFKVMAVLSNPCQGCGVLFVGYPW